MAWISLLDTSSFEFGTIADRGLPFSSGTPTGKSIKIAGKHDAYLATPPEDKAHKDVALLYIPDVIGIWQNSQLMADQFAANGYLTIIIDVFNGDPISLNRDEGFDFMKWLNEGSTGDNPHTKEAVDPIIVDAIKALQDEYGAKKIGALGYCFGAKVKWRPDASICHSTFVLN